MIGYFRTAEELQAWAASTAEAHESEFGQTGNFIALGYALAMADIAQSVVHPNVEVPAYQRDVLAELDDDVHDNAPVLLRAA